MKEFLAALDSLVKRGLSSSLTFLSLLFVSEWVAGTLKSGKATSLLDYWGTWTSTNLPSAHSTWATVLAVTFLVIGLSYTLSAVNELVYDNTLREDFDPWIKRTPYNRSISDNLASLRSSVIAKLKSDVPDVEIPRYTDFCLYEIIGGILDTDTRQYVDAAKALGMVFVSVILVGFVEVVIHAQSLSWWSIGTLLALCCVVYFLGREAIKTQYRSRAIRLYINFMMTPSETVIRSLQNEHLESSTGEVETVTEPSAGADA